MASAPVTAYAPKSVLDIAGLDRLKAAAASDPSGNLEQVARGFSSLFIDEMLQSMQDAGFHATLTNNRGTRLYQSLLNQQIAQDAAGHGVGLATMLVRALRAREASPAIPVAQPKSLAGLPAAGALATMLNAAATAPALSERETVPIGRVLQDAAATPAAPIAAIATSLLTSVADGQALPAPTPPALDGVSSGTVATFVARFGAQAESVARRIGVPAKLVLAQAALETGWGRHPAGGSGHNLFGIKAGNGWSGSAAMETTTEDADGTSVATTAAFRTYASDAQSFEDYAHLIGTDPRYASVRAAATPEQAAWALQYAGYATDPAYASKLIDVMHEIGALPVAGARTGVELADVSAAAAQGSS